MSDVTVRQLAEVVGIPLDRLLTQLGDAGLAVNSADDMLSDSEKLKLLSYLRQSHGKDQPAGTEPKKVTLQRRTVSELKQGKVMGKNVKTVSVQVRKKRTYVKRSELPETDERRLKADKAILTAISVGETPALPRGSERLQAEQNGLPVIRTIVTAPKTPSISSDPDNKESKGYTTRLAINSSPKIFISYSHKDNYFLQRLKIHFKPFERKFVFEAWDDSKIRPGMIWRDEIQKALNSAKVAIILVQHF